MDVPQQMVIQIPKEGEASVMEAVTEEHEGDDDWWCNPVGESPSM